MEYDLETIHSLKTKRVSKAASCPLLATAIYSVSISHTVAVRESSGGIGMGMAWKTSRTVDSEEGNQQREEEAKISWDYLG